MVARSDLQRVEAERDEARNWAEELRVRAEAMVSFLDTRSAPLFQTPLVVPWSDQPAAPDWTIRMS